MLKNKEVRRELFWWHSPLQSKNKKKAVDTHKWHQYDMTSPSGCQLKCSLIGNACSERLRSFKRLTQKPFISYPMGSPNLAVWRSCFQQTPRVCSVNSPGLVWVPVSWQLHVFPLNSLCLFCPLAVLWDDYSSITLRLLLPACSACSAFWKTGPVAECPRIRDVETACTQLIHLENKIQLQLSTFQGDNLQVAKVFRTKASLEQYFGEGA